MASLTITTPAGEDARIQTAFGKYLSLPGPATGAQIKQAVADFMKAVVRDQERLAALAAANVVDVTPT